jgi:broad specificity phosphatase PhoE
VRTLLLVRHAAPLVDPAVPAADWILSEAGRAACGPLAAQLVPYRPAAIISSREAKAIETARLVAAPLGLTAETATGLHEQDRRGVPVLAPAAWRDRVRDLFAHPDERVLGVESAAEATARFAAAIDALLAARPAGDLAVVAHGTVISLLVARHNAVDGFAFWAQLAMPALVPLALPGFRLQALSG